MQPAITSYRLRLFNAKWMPEPNSGCHLWLAGINEHGYGVFWNGERLEKAHRFALRATGVDVPADADVCHDCDNTFCVNDRHVYVGDVFTNMADALERGRHRHPAHCGEAHYGAKLTEHHVADIRRRAARGELHRLIADDYGVHKSLISHIKRGKNWVRGSACIISPSS
jgi:hypothetical protein